MDVDKLGLQISVTIYIQQITYDNRERGLNAVYAIRRGLSVLRMVLNT